MCSCTIHEGANGGSKCGSISGQRRQWHEGDSHTEKKSVAEHYPSDREKAYPQGLELYLSLTRSPMSSLCVALCGLGPGSRNY